MMTNDSIEFSASHAIKTPTQIGPYRTSNRFADSPGYALHKAISGLTNYYREAVNAGYEPAESWLVKI